MNKKEQIKAVALSLFAQHSYEGTSLSQIAQGAGIKTPSIYAHFKDKEELYLSVYRDVVWDYVQHVRQSVGGNGHVTVERKLYAFLADTCRYYKSHADEVALLKRTLVFPPDFLKEKLRAEFLASEEATTAILRQIFAEGIEIGEIRRKKIGDLLAAYYCMVDGLFLQMYVYDPADFEGRMESVWNIFWSGIRRADES